MKHSFVPIGLEMDLLNRIPKKVWIRLAIAFVMLPPMSAFTFEGEDAHPERKAPTPSLTLDHRCARFKAPTL